MDRLSEKYLVTYIYNELELSKTKVFSSYERAKAYFMELVGKQFLTDFHDAPLGDAYGGRSMEKYYKEEWPNTYHYFESGSTKITELPLTSKEFKEDLKGLADFGIPGVWYIKIMIIQEVD